MSQATLDSVPLLEDNKRFGSESAKTSPSCNPRRTLRDVLAGVCLASLCFAMPGIARWGGGYGSWQSPKPCLPPAHDPKFPSGDEIGYPGPTPLGAEPFLAAAASQPSQQSYFPLAPSKALNSSPEFEVVRSFGYLSPFHSLPANTFGLSPESYAIPAQCRIKQVHLLHRHGARYPVTGGEPAAFAARLKSATRLVAKNNLRFLNGYQYRLGAEVLTPFGRHQLFSLGTGFRQKYGGLLERFTKQGRKLVFRTTSQHRMVHSALNFASGFFGLPIEDKYYQSIIIDADGFNNTLSGETRCPRAWSRANWAAIGKIRSRWENTYLAEARDRLQSDVEGYKFEIADIYAMQLMCAYETVSLGYSEFCSLFTEDEFKDFAYSSDLLFWYGFGFGSPYSAAVGIGWVQELVARLTRSRILDHQSTTNSTLDDDPVTFPLDQPIYVDATHDTTLSSVLVALNLSTFTTSGPPPTDRRPDSHSFVSAHIAPFSANLQVQVVECKGEASNIERVRFLLNDAVVPMAGVEGCRDDENGFCDKTIFVEAMHRRIAEVDYHHDCSTDYEYKQPESGGGIVGGRPPS